MKPTIEQEEMLRIRQGFHVCSANAGTGKTHTMAELLAACFLEEESRRLKRGERHLRGPDQLAVLEQVRAVSFTVDAAAELNERIWKILTAAGVEVPQTYGKPYRISRTMDSFIQGWLRKPPVLASLLKVEPDLERALHYRRVQFSGPFQQRLLASTKGNEALALWRNWPWLADEDLSEMVFDVVVARGGVHPCGLASATWEAELREWTAGCVPPEEGHPPRIPVENFWAPMLARWKGYQHEMRDLENEFRKGRLHMRPDYTASLDRLEKWRPLERLRRDVLACYDIAKARGYHPLRAVDRLASTPVLDELSACTEVETWKHLHDLCSRYFREKMRFGMFDHSDMLVSFVDALKGAPYLVEKDAEYPRMGIRAKYMVFDEFQDNNPFQMETVRWMCGKSSVPFLVMAVGDIKQGIYAFRGACSYGFAQVLDSVKKRTPENLHHLTVSFRSLQSIVALGNTVSMTLPPYKDKVQPSSTLYTEAGTLQVAPPFRTEEEEATWVAREVQAELVDTTHTVMVLHRNNLKDSPLGRALSIYKDNPRLSILTIHRSKGLQADTVFVCGMNAGTIPDPRTSFVQEVNLFYVAVTRPRRRLVVTASYEVSRVTKEGLAETQVVGLSRFVSATPELGKLADAAGWTDHLVKRGVNFERQAAAVHQQQVDEKHARLRREWRDLFPSVPLRAGVGDEICEEVGAAPKRLDIAPQASLFEAGGTVREVVQALDAADPNLQAKLQLRFLKNGALPALNRADFGEALRRGWVRRGEKGRYVLDPCVMEGPRGVTAAAATG